MQNKFWDWWKSKLLFIIMLLAAHYAGIQYGKTVINKHIEECFKSKSDEEYLKYQNYKNK